MALSIHCAVLHKLTFIQKVKPHFIRLLIKKLFHNESRAHYVWILGRVFYHCAVATAPFVSMSFFFWSGQPCPLSIYFCLFVTVQFLKLVANRIWTQIIRALGEDADHRTTITDLLPFPCLIKGQSFQKTRQNYSRAASLPSPILDGPLKIGLAVSHHLILVSSWILVSRHSKFRN